MKINMLYPIYWVSIYIYIYIYICEYRNPIIYSGNEYYMYKKNLPLHALTQMKLV